MSLQKFAFALHHTRFVLVSKSIFEMLSDGDCIPFGVNEVHWWSGKNLIIAVINSLLLLALADLC